MAWSVSWAEPVLKVISRSMWRWAGWGATRAMEAVCTWAGAAWEGAAWAGALMLALVGRLNPRVLSVAMQMPSASRGAQAGSVPGAVVGAEVVGAAAGSAFGSAKVATMLAA